MDDLYVAARDNVVRNNYDDPMPDPCPDCKRTYSVRETVSVNVKGRPDPVWTGCVDCWVRRTGPEMCDTFTTGDVIYPMVNVRLEDLRMLMYAFDNPGATALGSRPFARLRGAIKEAER